MLLPTLEGDVSATQNFAAFQEKFVAPDTEQPLLGMPLLFELPVMQARGWAKQDGSAPSQTQKKTVPVYRGP